MSLESEKLTPRKMMYVRESSYGRATCSTSEYSRNIKKLMEEFVAPAIKAKIQRVQIVDAKNGVCKLCGSGCRIVGCIEVDNQLHNFLATTRCHSPGVIDDGLAIEGFETTTSE
jgi:hypothetical protein